MGCVSSLFDSSEILSLLEWEEGDDLERKSSKGGLPKSVWETYSAMANTRGGILLLGVENDGTISGIKEFKSLLKNFWDTANNRGKISCNLLKESDIREISHPNGKVLAIRVPRADRHQRPVFIGPNPLTGTYRRNSEGDYRCTEQEVGRMLADSAQESADFQILEYFKIEDLDIASLQQYRQRFASLKPMHPWLNEDDKGFLSKLQGWRRCRVTGLEGITIAGLLMFGREEAIREAFPQYHVDFREKLSQDPLTRWTDRLTLDGTWAGNLYQFYMRAIQKLSSGLKLPFQLDSEFFRKDETVVHEALREALVNALIHADYQGQGGIVVEKYPDRFAFSNPGLLLMSLDQIFKGGISECRNKSLQHMFTMVGVAEKAGSGVDKIRRGWQSQHWRFPSIREDVQPDRVSWMLPMISLLPEESIERLRKKLGSRYEKLNQQEIQALVTVDVEGYVDNARLRQIMNMHPTDVTKLLQGLVDKDFLMRDGQKRWSRYCLALSLNEKLSAHMSESFAHMSESSAHMSESSAHMSESSAHAIAASVRERRKVTPEEMEQVILSLCQNQWLTKKELGEVLNRNPDGLRFRFLVHMVSCGLLKLRYPETPNHQNQAYMAQVETVV